MGIGTPCSVTGTGPAVCAVAVGAVWAVWAVTSGVVGIGCDESVKDMRNAAPTEPLFGPSGLGFCGPSDFGATKGIAICGKIRGFVTPSGMNSAAKSGPGHATGCATVLVGVAPVGPVGLIGGSACMVPPGILRRLEGTLAGNSYRFFTSLGR